MTTDQMPNGTKSTGKSGPKPDPARATMRRLFSDWSDRTFARYWKAHQLLVALMQEGALDRDGYEQAIKDSTRPSGSINVTRLSRIAEGRLMLWLVQQRDEKTQNAA
jgi:hypothetical protein